MADEKPIQRPNQYARLVAIGGGSDNSIGTAQTDAANSPVIIDFPAMPEVIDLVRSSKFQVETPPNIPDGLHFYLFTEPLKIPFSFKLSAYDDSFAPQGGVTLLYIASMLHALALPIGIDQGAGKTTAPQQPEANPQNKTDPAQGEAKKDYSKFSSLNLPAWPAVCFLSLIGVSPTNGSVGGRGIACTGYIENVSAKLKGPFLYSDDNSYNIPSSAEFSFTFVHAPSYRNKPYSQAGAKIKSAFSGDVLSSLYSTYPISQQIKGGIQPITKTA